MADVAGFIGDYVNENSGLMIENAWIEIFAITYMPNKHVVVPFQVYFSQADYEAGKAYVCEDRKTVEYGSPDWETYFSTGVLDQSNRDILGQTLAFLNTFYSLGTISKIKGGSWNFLKSMKKLVLPS